MSSKTETTISTTKLTMQLPKPDKTVKSPTDDDVCGDDEDEPKKAHEERLNTITHNILKPRDRFKPVYKRFKG